VELVAGGVRVREEAREDGAADVACQE
jgi:hypothetical protein